jgi:hypothetical protein
LYVLEQLTGRPDDQRRRDFEGYIHACGDTKGFGYAMWHDPHSRSQQVLAGIGGCAADGFRSAAAICSWPEY